MTGRKPTKRELWKSRDQAIAQRDEARALVEQLMQTRVLTCVYCGHEYPQDTPAAGSEVLTEHIAVCEKHPMRGFIALLTEAAERLEAAGMLGQMSHRFQAWRLGGVAPLPFCDSVFSEPGGFATHCELTAGHSVPHKRGSFHWANTIKCPGRRAVGCGADISFHDKLCSECATEGPV